VEPRCNPEFLDDLPGRGIRRVFVQLDMASGRKPAFGISVVDQKDLSLVGIE
jgi:hypothetical protein